MRYRFARLAFVVGVVGLGMSVSACGKEIGDACTFSTDCDPNGTRLCDVSSHDGYCTIMGCDYSTCPDEAVCVQFFNGTFSNLACDPSATVEECSDPSSGKQCCSLDELCSVNGHCVPRSSEFRYCMRKCGSDGDCRDGYECRNLEKMIAHGGQPVLPPPPPGQPAPVVTDSSPHFCAAAAPSP